MTPKEFNKSFGVNLMQLGVHLHPFVAGHFRGTSGNCVLKYFDKDAVLANVIATNRVASYLVQLVADYLREIDCIVAMAPSASEFAKFFAMQWMTKKSQQVLSVHAEKKEGSLFIRPTYIRAMQSVTPIKIVIIEDAVTTGGSVIKLIGYLRTMGFDVAGVIAVCEHEQMSARDFGVPFYKALVTIGDRPLSPEECPKCRNSIDHDKILGHG